MKHYTGESLPIKFDMLMENRKANIMRAVVEVYGPNSVRLLADTPTFKRGEVYYSLPGEYTMQPGLYNFIFRMQVRGYGDISHVIKRKVLKMRAGNKTIQRVIG